jgi:ATP-dependent Clp protease protease subunit
MIAGRKKILRAHIKMGQEKWAHLDRADLWFSPQEAIECGVADEVGDFAPPKGSVMYNV